MTTCRSPTVLSSPDQPFSPLPPWLRIQPPSGRIFYLGKAPARGNAQRRSQHSRCAGVRDLVTVIYHPLNMIHLLRQLKVALDFNHYTALRVSNKLVIQQKILLSFPLQLAAKPCLSWKSRMDALERRGEAWAIWASREHWVATRHKNGLWSKVK